MRDAKLACKTRLRFKATTHSKHDLPIAESHLDRQLDVQQPNQVYAGDVTYIYTQEGWLYLAVVIDLFSRQIVGWSMAEPMRSKLVNNALLMTFGSVNQPKNCSGIRPRQPIGFGKPPVAIEGIGYLPKHEL
ncbi:MAG: DDE-type integrase/transposase/recombinase [Methylobacter sp.]|nr:DDE-type integrase/transposase/recombinase [Methylobacter sp.]